MRDLPWFGPDFRDGSKFRRSQVLHHICSVSLVFLFLFFCTILSNHLGLFCRWIYNLSPYTFFLLHLVRTMLSYNLTNKNIAYRIKKRRCIFISLTYFFGSQNKCDKATYYLRPFHLTYTERLVQTRKRPFMRNIIWLVGCSREALYWLLSEIKFPRSRVNCFQSVW